MLVTILAPVLALLHISYLDSKSTGWGDFKPLLAIILWVGLAPAISLASWLIWALYFR